MATLCECNLVSNENGDRSAALGAAATNANVRLEYQAGQNEARLGLARLRCRVWSEGFGSGVGQLGIVVHCNVLVKGSLKRLLWHAVGQCDCVQWSCWERTSAAEAVMLLGSLPQRLVTLAYSAHALLVSPVRSSASP